MSEFDVLILGGGPAGISAAIWADELGLSSAIVDRGAELGGQLHHVHNEITNYPGAEFKNGAEMADELAKQISQRSTKLFLGHDVTAVDVANRKLTFTDGGSVAGRSLILATGVRRRKLGLPGEREFFGKGILDSGAKDPRTVTGKTVAIIGGGDAALENALLLSEWAEKVCLVHRRSGFSARQEYVTRVLEDQKIVLFLDCEVVRFTGNGELEAVVVRDDTDKMVQIGASKALIRIGFQPNSELVRSSVACDDSGYISVDRACATNVSDIYAIGDVARRNSQTIASAIGDGVTAVSSIISLDHPKIVAGRKF